LEDIVSNTVHLHVKQDLLLAVSLL